MAILRQELGAVRLHRNQRRKVAIVGLRFFTLRDGPDDLIAIRGLNVEDLEFALLILVIGLLVGILLECPASVDVVTVHDAIAIVPVEVLIEDSSPDFLERFLIDVRALAEKFLIDLVGDEAIAIAGQMDAVDRQRLLLRGSAGKIEQIDELYVVGFRDVRHCLGV